MDSSEQPATGVATAPSPKRWSGSALRIARHVVGVGLLQLAVLADPDFARSNLGAHGWGAMFVAALGGGIVMFGLAALFLTKRLAGNWTSAFLACVWVVASTQVLGFYIGQLLVAHNQTQMRFDPGTARPVEPPK